MKRSRISCKEACSFGALRRTAGPRTAIMLLLMCGALAPASARSDLGPEYQVQQTSAETTGQRGDQGQCAISKQWSQARLQNYWPGEGRVQSRGGLGYVGRSGASHSADIAEAKAQVERVERISGLEMNFELIVDNSTPAAAAIINGRRVILFDPGFMALVADRICQDWGAMSILAHEVGHHLAGHTLRQSTEPWRDELEADQFSGFVLARLGASIAETTSAAARILPEQAMPTHPGRKDRIAAIMHGWQNAKAMVSAEISTMKQTSGLVPMRQVRYQPGRETAGPPDLTLVARIILYGDPKDYYITQSGRIDAYDGLRWAVGSKSQPSDAKFAWTLQTDAARFDVDYAGHVSFRLPSGTEAQVGVVVGLLPRAANGE
jgi:hypothetical protein